MHKYCKLEPVYKEDFLSFYSDAHRLKEEILKVACVIYRDISKDAWCPNNRECEANGCHKIGRKS